MTFGKVIAWNEENQRGIIETNAGETLKFERKDFVADLEVLKIGLEVTFEVWEEERQAYAVRSSTGEFLRFHDMFGSSIA